MLVRLRSKRRSQVEPGASHGSGSGTGVEGFSTSSRMNRNPDFQPTVPGYCANWHTHGASVAPGTHWVTDSLRASPPRAMLRGTRYASAFLDASRGSPSG